MKKRWLAGLMTHQYEKLPVTMKLWMQFNVMPWTLLGETQWSKTCSTVIHLTSQHRRVTPRSKCPCVRYVCLILNLWIIISSRRGKRNMLITFTLRSIECSLSSVAEFQRSCHCFRAWIRTSDLKSEWETFKLDTGRRRAAFAAHLPPSYLPVRHDKEPRFWRLCRHERESERNRSWLPVVPVLFRWEN